MAFATGTAMLADCPSRSRMLATATLFEVLLPGWMLFLSHEALVHVPASWDLSLLMTVVCMQELEAQNRRLLSAQTEVSSSPAH